ncbi:MAG: hypothetical protein LBI72_03255 [Flavobacteriaceae bacterium]|jgi:hypothetical protein|nr:hypothetical protein [Flavobacteriaceae bacterium]
MNIDLTKPTTIYCKYIDNDITGEALIGDFWLFGEVLTDYDKTTFLGAMNYVVQRLTSAYPHVKWVFFSESWRLKEDRYGVKVPPYLFENSAGNVGLIYSIKEKENCERIGLSFFDFVENGIQNSFNNSEYFVDATHFNYNGWKLFSEKLKDLYKSFK